MPIKALASKIPLPKGRIFLKNANNKVCEWTKKGDYKGVIGLIHNAGSWGSSWSGSLLDFKTGKPIHLTGCRPTGTARLIQGKELEEIWPDDTSMILAGIPLRGGICGADPEVFVVDKTGTIIPAFTFLPAKPKTKEAGRGACFWDGFQAEFTPGACSCMAGFTDLVRNCLSQVLFSARKVEPTARLSWKSVLDIPEKLMRKATAAQVDLGCEPSLNAYYGIEPVSVDDPTTLFFRFAGSHIHMGIGKQTRKAADKIIKTIDAIFGPMSVSLLRGMEDPRRRAFYGRAGEFRLPAHGIEYRTPSSAMLSHPAIWHLCFEFIRAATCIGMTDCLDIWKAREKDTTTAINYHDIGKAEMILHQNEKVVKGILDRRFMNDKVTKRGWELITKGALEYYPGIDDMEVSWRLKEGAGWRSSCGAPNCCVERMTDSVREKKEIVLK